MEIIGEVRIFTPESLLDMNVFMLCDGSLLSKNEHPALFNLIGYEFSDWSDGDMFALPIIPQIFNGNSQYIGTAYITVKGMYPNVDGLAKIKNGGAATTKYANNTYPIE